MEKIKYVRFSNKTRFLKFSDKTMKEFKQYFDEFNTEYAELLEDVAETRAAIKRWKKSGTPKTLGLTMRRHFALCNLLDEHYDGYSQDDGIAWADDILKCLTGEADDGSCCWDTLESEFSEAAYFEIKGHKAYKNIKHYGRCD